MIFTKKEPVRSGKTESLPPGTPFFKRKPRRDEARVRAATSASDAVYRAPAVW
jgi:hypothetical protein